MPCPIRRRAARLIANNRFIGQYPRPKPEKSDLKKAHPVRSGRRQCRVLANPRFGRLRGSHSSAALCCCSRRKPRPSSISKASSAAPSNSRAAAMAAAAYYRNRGSGTTRHVKSSSERRLCLCSGGQDQGKGRHPGGDAEQQRRQQRAATVIRSGAIVATRHLDAADQRDARQRRPAGLLAVALERNRFRLKRFALQHFGGA